MPDIQIVRCPNCGDFAERQLVSDWQSPECEEIIQTSCPACDYLMVMALPTGRVIEAYAPGRSVHLSPATCPSKLKNHLWSNHQVSEFSKQDKLLLNAAS